MTPPTIACRAPASPLPLRGRAERFLSGAELLAFLLAALAGYEGFLLLTIFGPTGGGWMGEFVRDFQLWCYRPDPRSGGLSWSAVALMAFEPLFVVGVAALLWRDAWRQLREAGAWVRHLRAAAAGLALVLFAVGGLVAYARFGEGRASGATLPPFPGETIRVRLPVPPTSLRDQRGESFRLADLRGRVVLVTGIYAACSTTCPEIIQEIGAVLAELTPEERAGLSVVALSLNPEYETTELMAAFAESRGFSHPEFRYVNGDDVAEMRALLTSLQFSATRDPATGVINHANLFLLVDRRGDIAYRFSLDPRHRAWLRDGLRALLREPHGAGPES